MEEGQTIEKGAVIGYIASPTKYYSEEGSNLYFAMKKEEEGQTIEKGAVIGYIASPTKYYSEEGSNLYFAMKKDGEPVDPIAYLPE